ncbi:hypothetical protein ACFLVW_02610 [Chloroflexota bacterium]
MMTAITRIQELQQEWALQYKGRTKFTDYQDNLFEELKSDAKNEYASGDGQELTNHMYSLISSSALCCNFFHYWRYHNPSELCQALSIKGNVLRFSFEEQPQKPEGIPGNNPNIDVIIASDDGELTAIECKFTEPFQSRGPDVHASKPLAKSYFGSGISIWQTIPRSRDLARRLPYVTEGGVPFHHLAADQLLKHAVGLLNTYPKKNWRLVYLWYDDGSVVAENLRIELERFMEAIGDDFRFEHVTYQGLFSRLCEEQDARKSRWANYMRRRYFSVL